MTLPALEVDVQKGVAQLFHIGGIVAGWGTALAAGILTLGHLLPAGVATRYGLDITGISAAVGTFSTWLLTHTRTTVYQTKVSALTSYAFTEIDRLEKLVGIGAKSVGDGTNVAPPAPPSPTIPTV